MHTTTRKIFTLIALAGLLFSGMALAADASEKWIHIKVDGDDGEKITVNLPIALIGAAVDMVPPSCKSRSTMRPRSRLTTSTSPGAIYTISGAKCATPPTPPTSR